MKSFVTAILEIILQIKSFGQAFLTWMTMYSEESNLPGLPRDLTWFQHIHDN